MHAILRRYLVEDLVRKRQAGEHQRSGAARRGRIDPNPHQIDAVMFALERLPEGGCILADEVGLGKTIEAGLVIAQRLAEGARRILLIVPTSLVPQWQSELSELFLVETRDGTDEPLDEAGTFLVSRDWAGNEKGAAKLRATEPFDLCIIDEAHEIFAGIHKRYDRHGQYQTEGREAIMAHRVREAINPPTPIVLLTATPIQNSLAELWGLVQYVEPTGTLLGNLATFRQVFCDGDDRLLLAEQATELKGRLDRVLKRTLRREAQGFLTHPFVERRARLYEYEMTPAERSLYNDVTAYLLEPNLCAFAGSSRRLLLIGFHRRMASSSKALAASLRNVVARLTRYLEAVRGNTALPDDDFVKSEFEDLEDEGLPELGGALARAAQVDEATLSIPTESSVRPTGSSETGVDENAAVRQREMAERIERELERVQAFSERAENLPHDSKAAALLRALKTAQATAAKKGTSGKAVVFTESRVTQRYLRELLMKDGGLRDEDITLFSSTNDSPRAMEALDRWQEEVGKNRSRRAQRQTAVRAALVHEFRERSKVFISTEAGAKGLNLQFCETLINYDLPWNPQRIEQRIGRCHRYGQKHEVMVINFTSRDNEAQRLTFEILSRKLDLFGTVLDASDQVLHEPGTESTETISSALGTGFEKSLAAIYERARTQAEIEAELRKLRDNTEDRKKRFEEELSRTAGIIENRFHEQVKQRFNLLKEELPKELAELDGRMERVVRGYLDTLGISYEVEAAADSASQRVLTIPANTTLPAPLSEGLKVSLNGARRESRLEALHAAHPLIEAAIEEARNSTQGTRTVAIDVAGSEFEGHRGKRGVLRIEKVTYQGFEAFERLLTLVLLEDDTWLMGDEARPLLEQPTRDRPPLDPPLDLDPELLDEALEEALFVDQEVVSQRAQKSFEKALTQLDRYIADQTLVLKQKRRVVSDRMAAAEDARDAAVGTAARTRAEQRLKALEAEAEELDAELQRLSDRDDERFETWRQRAHQRRYAEPLSEPLLTAELELI